MFSLLSGIHHFSCAVNYSKHTILSNLSSLAKLCVDNKAEAKVYSL